MAKAPLSGIGCIGLNYWGNDVYEEYLPSLRWPQAGKVYKEMSSNDPVITAILLCARQLIHKVTWKVEPASTNAADVAAAEFIQSCMDDMSMTWSDLVNDITSYFEYGWSYHEIIYKQRQGDSRDPSKRSKFTDNRIGWRKLSGRSQDSWAGWEFDSKDDGSCIGMYQYANKPFYDKVFIPIEKALLFRTTSSRGNPEGRSFLRGAYRPWYFKKHIEEIEGIGIERDLAGLPKVILPESVNVYDEQNPQVAAAKSAAATLVKNVRRDKSDGLVLPFGWEFELVTSGGSRQFDTNAIINRYDQRISITLLADIVMLGADKVGSFALANVKKSLLAAALDAQVRSIADVINMYAIPRLFSFNVFPGITLYPKIVPSPVDTPDLTELGNYIGKLAGAKAPLFPDINLENYLRSVANFPLTQIDSKERQQAIDIHSKPSKDPKNPDGNPDDDPDSKKKPKEGGEE